MRKEAGEDSTGQKIGGGIIYKVDMERVEGIEEIFDLQPAFSAVEEDGQDGR